MRINKDQYQAWLENPVTEVFIQYLKDLADETRKPQQPDFIARSLDDLIRLGSQVTEATIQRDVLESLATLAFDDIESFYQKEEE